MLIHTCLETDTEMPIYPPLVLNETILIIQNTKYLPLSFVCLGNKVGMNLGRGSAGARCMLAAVVWNISDISLINQCVLGWGTAGGFCSLSDHTSLMGFYIYIYIYSNTYSNIYIKVCTYIHMNAKIQTFYVMNSKAVWADYFVFFKIQESCRLFLVHSLDSVKVIYRQLA